jgi:hypothetical protein
VAVILGVLVASQLLSSVQLSIVILTDFIHISSFSRH